MVLRYLLWGPCQSSNMSNHVMLQIDCFSVLQTFFKPNTLLKFSMVNKTAKLLVDTLAYNQFNKSLGFVLGRCIHSTTPILEHDVSARSLNITLSLMSNSLAQFIFSTHIYPVSGTVIQLRHSMLTPTKFCSHVSRNESLKSILIHFQSWKIDHLDLYETQFSIRLLAMQYSCSQHVKLLLPVYFTVHNIQNNIAISIREFSVMANMLYCRLCKIRCRSRHCYSAKRAEHRLLCLPCLKNFYVPFSSLQRTWKLNGKHVQRLKSNSCVYTYVNLTVAVSCTSCTWLEAVSNLQIRGLLETWVNKNDMAKLLFNCDWNHFVHNNATLPKIPRLLKFHRSFYDN